MPLLYVAVSKALAEWGASVGLTKHIYLVGLTDAPKDKVLAELNDAQVAGRGDWRLLKSKPTEMTEQALVLERIARREKTVDPDLYPGIRGTAGVFKVKPENVENRQLLQEAMTGAAFKTGKIKPADIAAYLLDAGDPPPAAED